MHARSSDWPGASSYAPALAPFGDGLNNNTVPYRFGTLQSTTAGRCASLTPENFQCDPTYSASFAATSASASSVTASPLPTFAPVRTSQFTFEDVFIQKPCSPPIESVPLPSLEKLPGKYGFEVSMPKNGGRAASWIFSEQLNKLYVHIATPCPIRVRTTGLPSTDCFLRATAVYTRPEHANEPVRCCIQHQAKESEPGWSHLIRIVNADAKYVEDSVTKRQCVIVPFWPQQSEWTTVLVQFSCFSSCIGGQNRRPICLVFTLERPNRRHCDGTSLFDDYEVLGRCSTEVRACACPRRDVKLDEQLLTNSTNSEQGSQPCRTAPAEKNSKTAKRKQQEDNQTYSLTVRGLENYLLLRRIRDALELAGFDRDDEASAVKKRKNLLCQYEEQSQNNAF